MNNVPTHSSSSVLWSKNHGQVDISALVEQCERFTNRVWPDSCDVGFWMKSHKTGVNVLFLLESQKLKDGEIVSWEFTSQDGRFRITVFNT